MMATPNEPDKKIVLSDLRDHSEVVAERRKSDPEYAAEEARATALAGKGSCDERRKPEKSASGQRSPR